MKILHISTSPTGGAARSCIRLHQGLLNIGIDSKLLTLYRSDSSIVNCFSFRKATISGKIIHKLMEIYMEKHNKFFLKNRPEGFEMFSFPYSPYRIIHHSLYRESDIINLHWVAGFLDYFSFFSGNKKKIIWTLHDMNPFTGGCHYSGDCTGFQKDCKNCPQLKGTINIDYAYKNLTSKLRALNRNKHLDLTIISPSKWLFEQLKSSILFKEFNHYHIPYSLDEHIYQPRDKKFSMDLLGIPSDKKVILFVSDSINNKRKGYEFLLKALEILKEKGDYVICAVGNKSDRNSKSANSYELGKIYDERLMSVAYSAADIFVIPSLEDNLPNTVLEALMCGTPVVGFPTGGIKDMIIHNVNGRLCKEISEQSLACEIEYILNNREMFNRVEISNQASDKYALKIQAENYLKVYCLR